MIIGLTGSSGSGKSVAAKFFAQKDFFVIDFDEISREICNKGEPCLNELTEQFGCDIIDSDGNLLRKKLGNIVFADSEKLKILNRITHKYILQKAQILVEQNKHRNIVYDAPLLFEAGLHKHCKYVVSIICNRETQITRIMKRDGISRATAEGRINSQQPKEFYIQQSDYYIDNSSTHQEFIDKLEKLLEDIYADNCQ